MKTLENINRKTAFLDLKPTITCNLINICQAGESCCDHGGEMIFFTSSLSSLILQQ